MTEALEDCFVTSKIGPRYHGHDGAHEGCEETLRKLNMDSIVTTMINWGFLRVDVVGSDADSLAWGHWLVPYTSIVT